MNGTLPWWVWDIVWFLSDLAWHIRQTADGIYDVWLVGLYLAEPFYIAADYVQGISNLFVWEDGTQGVIGTWILTLSTLENILSLLASLIAHFELFRQDPARFVQEFFAAISEEFYSFIYYTREWFTNNFLSQVDWLPDFIANPLTFILELLSDIAVWVIDFLENPLYYIEYWVRILWPNIDELIELTYNAIVGAIALVINWIWDFLEQPLAWIQDLLAEFNIYAELLLIDPYMFFALGVAFVLDLSLADLLDFPRYLWNYVLDWVVDYVQDTSDRFVQSACDVIMLFI